MSSNSFLYSCYLADNSHSIVFGEQNYILDTVLIAEWLVLYVHRVDLFFKVRQIDKFIFKSFFISSIVFLTIEILKCIIRRDCPRYHHPL